MLLNPDTGWTWRALKCIFLFNYWVLNEHTIICQSRDGLDSFTWEIFLFVFLCVVWDGCEVTSWWRVWQYLSRDGCFVYVETTVSRIQWGHTQTVQIQRTTLLQVVFFLKIWFNLYTWMLERSMDYILKVFRSFKYLFLISKKQPPSIYLGTVSNFSKWQRGTVWGWGQTGL